MPPPFCFLPVSGVVGAGVVGAAGVIVVAPLPKREFVEEESPVPRPPLRAYLPKKGEKCAAVFAGLKSPQYLPLACYM